MQRLINRLTGAVMLLGELQPGGVWLITETKRGTSESLRNVKWRIDPRTGRWMSG